MASLYQRRGSSFWWIKYRDPGTHRIVRASTGLNVGVVADTRRARELEAEKSLAEARVVRLASDPGMWDGWVTDFIRNRYGASPITMAAYLGSWRALSGWLDDLGIDSPSKLTRAVAIGYPQWRSAEHRTSHAASRNTAIQDLKVLRLVMSEAVRRGFCTVNPAAGLDLPRAPIREKPEIQPAEEEAIRRAIAGEPPSPTRDFLEASFEIAIHQGCRLRETCIHMDRIDEVAGTIGFVQKGRREHVTLLHPNLVPLVKAWRARGRTHTYDPAFTIRGGGPKSNPTLIWATFLRRIGLSHLCFHCTRVTVASRLARANVHEAKAMRFIGHASTMVHRLYQRLRVSDLADCLSAVVASGKHPSA